MMIQETLKKLDTDGAGKLMETLYGAAQAEENKARYRHVAEGFLKEYGDGDVCYSAPRDGQRSAEIHTDHNHGKVLAGSINLDCVGAAAKNGTDTVRSFKRDLPPEIYYQFKGLKAQQGDGGNY